MGKVWTIARFFWELGQDNTTGGSWCQGALGIHALGPLGQSRIQLYLLWIGRQQEGVEKAACQLTWTAILFLILVGVLESEPRPLYILNKYSNTEPHPQAPVSFASK